MIKAAETRSIVGTAPELRGGASIGGTAPALRGGASIGGTAPALRGGASITLGYRAPYDWPSMLAFWAARAMPGVERVEDGAYARTLCLGEHRGFVVVTNMRTRAALRVQVSRSLEPVLIPLRAVLRRAFDLDRQPQTIAEHLATDRMLALGVRARPGLRVPGAFEGFETAVRAVLGQQVSVAAATTLAGRLAAYAGVPIETPYPQLVRLTPAPERIAAAGERELSALGILPARARTLRALAAAVADASLSLDASLARGAAIDPAHVVEALMRLPGIGAWTAHYIAMRALAWTDAFPASDLGIRKALGGISARAALVRAEDWRPFRAYAAMHLWASLPAPKPAVIRPTRGG